MYVYYFLDDKEITARLFKKYSNDAESCAGTVEKYGEAMERTDGSVSLYYNTRDHSIIIRNPQNERLVHDMIKEMEENGLDVTQSYHEQV